MAEITKSGKPSLASVDLDAIDILGGLVAGEAIDFGDQVYINSDGMVYRSSGAAANAAAKVRGIAPIAADSGEAVTIISGDVTFNYGTGLTPGSDVFLSGTVAGGVATAASTGGTAAIGFVMDASRIRFFPSRY